MEDKEEYQTDFPAPVKTRRRVDGAGLFKIFLLLIALAIFIIGITGHFPSAHDCTSITSAGVQKVC